MSKTQIDESAVIEMYEQVENAREVSEKFNVSRAVVYRILKEHGIKRTHRHDGEKKEPKYTYPSHCRSKYCPALVVMLRKMLDLKRSDIVELTGYPVKAVDKIFAKRDLTRSSWYGRGYDLDQIEREYLDGASSHELGEKYGVKPNTISGWMRKRGIRKGHGNKLATPIEKTCPRCGKTFTTTHRDKEYCSKTCQRAVAWTRRHDMVRAAGIGDDIPLREVYERDRGRCYICGCKTDFNDYRIVDGYKLCGSRYPTRDHVIAIHNGGKHEWGNVRLACNGCNSRKQDKGQMRLAI